MNELLKKLKGTLEEKDLMKLEGAINKLISEKVEIRVDEEKTRLETLAEEFCTTETKSRVDAELETITEEYDEKMATLEEKLVGTIDKFIDSEISESISDEAIAKIAINETYKPIVDDIVSIFENKFVALDTEGHAILKEAKEEIESLEDKLSSTMAEKMELKEDVDESKSAILILKESEGLTETQKDRIVTFFEGKDYEEIKSKISSFVELITENEEEEDDDETVNEDVSDGDAGMDESEIILEDESEEISFAKQVENLL